LEVLKLTTTRKNFINNKYKVAVIGGAGHIGLPLSCYISSYENDVLIVDTNNENLEKIRSNKTPFKDDGLEEYIKIANRNNLKLSNNIELITDYELVIVALGTSSSQGTTEIFESLMESVLENISKNSKIILRSTVTLNTIEKTLRNTMFKEKAIQLAYCPERIAEGASFEEIKKLPQIIGINDGQSHYFELFFKSLGIKSTITNFKNAAFLKLFTNAYRYAEFSTVNNFYNIAVRNEINYDEIIELASLNYPRLQNMPSKGFVGGPCLIKDTETFKKEYDYENQLLANFQNTNLTFMNNILKLCNKSFPEKKLIQLGLTFKPNSDDLRDSLSLQLYFNLLKEGFEIYPVDDNVDPVNFKFKLYDFNEASRLTSNVLISTFHDSFNSLDFKDMKVEIVGNK
jgi:UDP-N-acetyl-D-mannosaminuronic acid dehydrogenase